MIIEGATESTGVEAEYRYLNKHFPGFQMGRQSLVHDKEKSYDVIEFTTKDGKRVIFFDITDFFGKP